MAHDFMITDVLDAVTPDDNPGEILAKLAEGRNAVFSGYGDAAMYKAFDAQEFDARVSGCFDGKIISKKEAAEGLAKAIALLASYPDPTRADDIKHFFKDVVLPAPDSQKFYIHYS